MFDVNATLTQLQSFVNIKLFTNLFAYNRCKGFYYYLCVMNYNQTHMDIKRIIKERGLTIEEVGRRMEPPVSKGTLSKVISTNPTTSTLERIAAAVGCRVADFFEDGDGVGNDFTAFVRNGGELHAFDSAESLKEYVDGLCGEAKRPDHANTRGKEYYRKSIMKMENKKMENIFIIKDGCLYDEMRYLKESVANRINSNICQLQHSGVNVMIRSMPEKPEDQEAFIKQNGYKREPELYDKLIIEYNTAHPKEPLSWWPRPNEKE